MKDMQNRHYYERNISDTDAGREILSILKGDLGFSAHKISSVKFDPEGILVNGAHATVRVRLKTGDRLQILMDDSAHRVGNVVPKEMPLDIIFEDSGLLVLNKPAGIVCHPSQGHYDDSLANGVRFYLDSKGERTGIHPAGRLDKDTSGLVVFAKNGTAEYELRQKEKSHFEKIYLALADGVFGEPAGTVSVPVQKIQMPGEVLRLSAAGEDDAKTHAVTHYRLVRQFPDYALISVKIETGRMHQIRFHMSCIGHPLLGDSLYGNGSGKGLERAALHAETVSFTHPFTGEHMEFHAPVPADMQAAIQ